MYALKPLGKRNRNNIAKRLAPKSQIACPFLLAVKFPENLGMAGSGIVDHHNEDGHKKISSSSRGHLSVSSNVR